MVTANGTIPKITGTAELSAFNYFERVGGTSIQEIDVRIIAASNRDLQTAVAQRAFRADLFYRLNIIHINLPPLRDRLDDLEELAYHFLAWKNITGLEKKQQKHWVSAALPCIAK